MPEYDRINRSGTRLWALPPCLCRNKHKGTPSMVKINGKAAIDGVSAFVITIPIKI